MLQTILSNFAVCSLTTLLVLIWLVSSMRSKLAISSFCSIRQRQDNISSKVKVLLFSGAKFVIHCEALSKIQKLIFHKQFEKYKKLQPIWILWHKKNIKRLMFTPSQSKWSFDFIFTSNTKGTMILMAFLNSVTESDYHGSCRVYPARINNSSVSKTIE